MQSTGKYLATLRNHCVFIQDGIRDARDELVRVVDTVRQNGLTGLLNAFRWNGHPFNHNFDANGAWRRPEARRTPISTPAQVQLILDSLPREKFAPDDELMSR